MRVKPAIAALAAAAMLPFAVGAAQARTVADVATPVAATEPTTIDIELSSGGERLWSGSLRLAAPHGSASYSQSKNEFAGICPGKGDQRNVSSNENLRLNINRRYSNQQVDQFSVTVNWTRPVAACNGGGTNTIGFQRPVELPLGGSATVSGAGGLLVRLTRR
ncbi:MAG: hypothetical protein KUG65_05515 [Sphingomonadaceae bacterium]|nr:hypothetical protein [Sphingomonadaceae bacterium]